MHNHRAGWLYVSVIFLFFLACGLVPDFDNNDDDNNDSNNNAATEPAATVLLGPIWRPAPGTSWQWQLTGAIDISHDVDMYDIDLFDTPPATIDTLHEQGRIVICYFSAGSWEEWRTDADAYPENVIGRPLAEWPDERWVDVRQLDALAPILSARLDLAVAKGCDGVEPDNVTAYRNETGFAISADDQLAFNRWLADAAHARGLSIGLKNNLEQVTALEPYFDWALNEECFAYDECELLLPFIAAGKAVFGVEYDIQPEAFCDKANALNFDWLYKDLDLGPERTACR